MRPDGLVMNQFGRMRSACRFDERGVKTQFGAKGDPALKKIFPALPRW